MNTSLCVSVIDEEVEEHHADDGQRHAKVSERAPDGPAEVLAVPEGREWTNQSRVCTVSLTGQISVTGQRPVFDRGYAVTRSGSKPYNWL